MYPSALRTLNISKETKKHTIMSIEGYPMIEVYDKQEKKHIMVEDIHAVGRLVCGANNPIVDSVAVCNEFFELPCYGDILDRFNF